VETTNRSVSDGFAIYAMILWILWEKFSRRNYKLFQHVENSSGKKTKACDSCDKIENFETFLKLSCECRSQVCRSHSQPSVELRNQSATLRQTCDLKEFVRICTKYRDFCFVKIRSYGCRRADVIEAFKVVTCCFGSQCNCGNLIYMYISIRLIIMFYIYYPCTRETRLLHIILTKKITVHIKHENVFTITIKLSSKLYM
jgi:hypothetical protein